MCSPYACVIARWLALFIDKQQHNLRGGCVNGAGIAVSWLAWWRASWPGCRAPYRRMPGNVYKLSVKEISPGT